MFNDRGLIDDTQEFIGFEARPTDQRPINFGLLHEFGGVGWVNAAAVENTHLPSDIFPTHLGGVLTNKRNRPVGLFTGGRLSGANQAPRTEGIRL